MYLEQNFRYNIYWELYKIEISQYYGSKFLNLIHKQTEGRILGTLEVLPIQTVTYMLPYASFG